MKALVLLLGCALPLMVSSLPLAPGSRQVSPATQDVLTGSTDIGSPLRGVDTHTPGTDLYRVGGGGADVWGTADSFRFTWTRVTGDAALTADVHIDAPVSAVLAKGMLMFRQSLDPGSPYADIALHADGHVTLQYRLTQGGETRDVNMPEHNPSRLRIVRQGDRFTAYAYTDGRPTMRPPAVTLAMQGPIYVGVGVCSHNTDVLQFVRFSGVTLDGGVGR